MANVVLKNIKKIYDKGVTAVSDFNLEIKDKEFVVFVGPSGCGKSTTLRMIAGLEKISEGECYIDNRLVNDVAPKDRDIAMVFQNYALYPHMSVYDNMAFALKLRKEKKSVIDERVNEAAEILDIKEYLNRKPKALSGGQRQRVAIGRAIVRQPKVFLMDEPLSNLDAKLRNQMRTEIIKLRERVNTTFIYVTHDQIEAMTLGDRIVVMKDGVIQQVGTPEQVYTQPANIFVAEFIGSPQINMLNGALKESDGKYSAVFYEWEIPLSDEKNEGLKAKNAPAGSVKLGIRPEHIKLADTNDESAVLAKIDVSEMMGAEMYLHVLVNDTPITVKVTEPDEIIKYVFKKDGANCVRLAFQPAKLHIFDENTEKNLLL